jgi:hypothetical protein
VPSPSSFAGLAAAVRARPPRLGATRLVCVDGPAGSGRTTFAGQLAAGLGAQVLHMDDVYAGWTLAGAFDRVAAGVLEPLRAGRAGAVRRWDWPTGRFAEPIVVPVAPALVLEGCGSAPRAADAHAVLRVWVEAPRDLRLRRGVERDGEAMRADWVRWLDQEAVEFATEDTRARADLAVDGAPAVPDRPGCFTAIRVSHGWNTAAAPWSG